MEHKTIKGVGGEVHYWISKTNHRSNEVIVFGFYVSTATLITPSSLFSKIRYASSISSSL